MIGARDAMAEFDGMRFYKPSGSSRFSSCAKNDIYGVAASVVEAAGGKPPFLPACIQSLPADYQAIKEYDASHDKIDDKLLHMLNDEDTITLLEAEHQRLLGNVKFVKREVNCVKNAGVKSLLVRMLRGEIDSAASVFDGVTEVYY